MSSARIPGSVEAIFSPAELSQDQAEPRQCEPSPGEQVRRHFEQLRDPLYRYMRSCGAAATDAEDIVQEAMIRLYRQLSQGARPPDVRPWVFRVAHNLLIDQKRELQRLGSAPPDADGLFADREQVDPCPNPEERMVQQERLRRLRQDIRNLTELQQECLNLRAEGLRYREIASVLDLSTSTVVDAVRRAVKNLGRRPE